MILEVLALGSGSGRLSGLLAFLICLLGHQGLLFLIGRWTIDLDGWRALFTATLGVAGLSMGSVLLPLWAAPLIAVVLTFMIMHHLYEMDWWQTGVMAAGWYAFGLGSLLLAGFLFAEPEPPPPPTDPPSKEELLEILRKNDPKPEASPRDPAAPGPAPEDAAEPHPEN